ncbi:BREX protein BrxB domain-containing protein [Candidatus Poriferisodalis sp.]|uniref:BREX protein BrxB domain-containing protein n=1 Tax=Candidatus Poriferisodalis sp. TaxID=3101277 RepID=UPI003B02CB65
MQLSEPLADISNQIVGYYDRQLVPPFIVYQYPPSDEYLVRQELLVLTRWLKAKHDIGSRTVSLAEIFWESLTEHGRLQMVVEAEQAGNYADAQLAVRQILATAPTLSDRIVAKIAIPQDEREAVFLYRAGALYPAHRTSSLLDALKDKIDRPVTMLYPGRLVGDYGLRFMGKTEPAYGYRALIVSREGKRQ